MRKVKLKTIMAGPAGVHHPGEIIEVIDEFAAQLVPQYAEYADVSERADLEGSQEQATIKPAKPRRRRSKRSGRNGN